MSNQNFERAKFVEFLGQLGIDPADIKMIEVPPKASPANREELFKSLFEDLEKMAKAVLNKPSAHTPCPTYSAETSYKQEETEKTSLEEEETEKTSLEEEETEKTSLEEEEFVVEDLGNETDVSSLTINVEGTSAKEFMDYIQFVVRDAFEDFYGQSSYFKANMSRTDNETYE